MISYERSSSLTDAMLTMEMLRSLKNLYPDFMFWFVNVALPGILVGRDILIVAKKNGVVIGVALGKISENETKLRCIRVLPEYQKYGVGIHLIDHMLRALNCAKPVCTVAEEMMHSYSRAFINYFHFVLSTVEKGLYRRGKLEYVFNGTLAVPTTL